MIKRHDYRIEQIGAERWREFKAIRLEALQHEPSVFGGSYEKDAALTDDDWIRGLCYPLRATFLLFHHNDIIGMTIILREKDNPENAQLFASYIRKEHRGKGLSSLFYDARLNWAWANGVSRVIADHRVGNGASEAAMRAYGLKQTHTETQTWPDGTVGEKIYYARDI